MKNDTLELKHDLVIMGIAVRTDPTRAATDLPALWQRFSAEHGEGPVYAVYCDYESDHAGPYTLVLGRELAVDKTVPTGKRRVRIPAGQYARFKAAGDPKQVIGKTWQHINGAWEKKHQRRYIADFERYVGAPKADGSIEAEILVGL